MTYQEVIGCRRVSARPSLSVRRARQGFWGGSVSPGSRPRPSLSELARVGGEVLLVSVAGVSAPAFVERGEGRGGVQDCSGVAGVSAPAFVERPVERCWLGRAWHLRVAGVSAPAFVERRC